MSAGAPGLLLVTGASGAGKSTVCEALAGRLPGAIPLDADLLWGDGFARSPTGTRDFCARWLRVCAAIGRAGRPVALFGAGTGVPANLAACEERAAFGRLAHLALVCAPERMRARLRARPAWRACGDEAFIARQLSFDAWLREQEEIEVLDTTHEPVDRTAEAVRAWVQARLAEGA